MVTLSPHERKGPALVVVERSWLTPVLLLQAEGCPRQAWDVTRMGDRVPQSASGGSCRACVLRPGSALPDVPSPPGLSACPFFLPRVDLISINPFRGVRVCLVSIYFTPGTDPPCPASCPTPMGSWWTSVGGASRASRWGDSHGGAGRPGEKESAALERVGCPTETLGGVGSRGL